MLTGSFHTTLKLSLRFLMNGNDGRVSHERIIFSQLTPDSLFIIQLQIDLIALLEVVCRYQSKWLIISCKRQGQNMCEKCPSLLILNITGFKSATSLLLVLC